MDHKVIGGIAGGIEGVFVMAMLAFLSLGGDSDEGSWEFGEILSASLFCIIIVLGSIVGGSAAGFVVEKVTKREGEFEGFLALGGGMVGGLAGMFVGGWLYFTIAFALYHAVSLIAPGFWGNG